MSRSSPPPPGPSKTIPQFLALVWHLRGWLALWLLMTFPTSPGTAQPARLLRDMNRDGSISSSMATADALGTRLGWNGFVTAGGKGYFFAYDALHGNELWVTDGTTPGTQLVREINPGVGTELPPSLRPDFQLMAAGSAVFFAASDPQFGPELFKTDGTAAGTIPVADFRRGASPFDGRPLGARPVALATIGSTLYFATLPTTNDFGDTRGLELWKTDGANSTRLTHPAEGSVHGVVTQGTVKAGVLDGVLYYVASTEEHGAELWRSDGTPQGTYLLKDLWPEKNQESVPLDSFPDWFIHAGRYLYFTARTDGFQNELWRTDGTAEGTRLVKDFTPGTVPNDPDRRHSSFHSDPRAAALGDFLLVNANRKIVRDDLELEVRSLYITDGSDRGTRLLAAELQIDEGPVVAGGKAWFISGGQLHMADTNGVRPIVSGYGPIATVANRVYFTRALEDGGQTLAAIDSGTETLLPSALNWRDAAGPVVDPAPFGKLLFFSFNDGVHGFEPWITDGTPEGTRMLKDINTANESGMHHTQDGTAFIDVNGRAYFRSQHPAFNSLNAQLWVTDGTATGTTMVSGSTTPDGSFGRWGAVFQDALFFADAESVVSPYNAEVFRATGAQARLFADLYPLDARFEPPINPSSAPDDFFKAGPHLYFKARNPFVDPFTSAEDWMELWRTDGTEAGTIRLMTTYPGANFTAGPRSFVELNGYLYFINLRGRENTFLYDYSLWRSDGTAAGTVMLESFDSAPTTRLYPLGDKLIWGMKTNLWSSDGTKGGARVIKTAPFLQGPGPFDESKSSFVTFKNRLWYLFTTGDRNQTGLYKTDGTEAGTALVLPYVQGQSLTPVGDHLYFAGSQMGPTPWEPATPGNPFSANEIFRTDGTIPGSQMIYNEVFERDASLGILGLMNIGEVLFFTRGDAAHGLELWRCDGTRAGTTMVQDIFPGPDDGASPGNNRLLEFTIAGTNVFFLAANELGLEPWVMPLSARLIPAPVISVAVTNFDGTVGTPVQFPVTVISGGPVKFTAHNLPPGLAIDSGAGLITGTPMFHGTYEITIDAVNGGATRSVVVTFRIAEAVATRLAYSRLPGSDLVLTLIGPPARQFDLQTSTNLTRWETFKTGLVSGSEVLITPADMRAVAARFFRSVGR